MNWDDPLPPLEAARGLPGVEFKPPKGPEDFYSKVYNGLYRAGYHKGPHHHLARPVVRYIAARAGQTPIRVLDVGGAYGAAGEMLEEMCHDAQVLTIDISMPAVLGAQDEGRWAECGSALDLDMSPNQFDVVMSSDFMEHLRPEDVDQAIHEQVRVLKPGGFMCHKICPRPDGPHNKRLLKPAGADHLTDRLHLTVRSLAWWIEQYEKHGGRCVWRRGQAFAVDFS